METYEPKNILIVNEKNLYKALVKRRMIVDDSWFSPNYHQLTITSYSIIHMVKRPKKFQIADDSSLAVARAKSRQQLYPGQRQGRASYSSIRRNIRYGHHSISPHCPFYPMNGGLVVQFFLRCLF